MKFSVVIPVYKNEISSYFNESLSSILCRQSLKPNEVIIIADGPLNEELYSVISTYELRYPDLIKSVYLEENMGMGYAMNVGLNCAKYDWIVRMDSDDIAVENRFEKQIKFLNENQEIDVLGSNIEEFLIRPGDYNHFRKLPSTHLDIIRKMKTRSPFNHMTVIFRKTLAQKAGGYWSLKYYEDYNLWYQMYKRGGTFANLSESLVHARVGNNMVARRKGNEYLRCEKVLYQQLLRDNFITKMEYILILNLKRILRSLPEKVLERVYRLFLRS